MASDARAAGQDAVATPAAISGLGSDRDRAVRVFQTGPAVRVGPARPHRLLDPAELAALAARPCFKTSAVVAPGPLSGVFVDLREVTG